MVNVAQYIQFGKYAQQADANINSMKQVLKGGMPVQKYVRLLFIVRRAVEWMYGMNPTDATLDQTANYLFALSGSRNLTVTPPVSPFLIIVQPQSQSADEGDNVVFTVQTAGGIAPIVYQWYFNLVPMAGEEADTLTINNVDGSNSGDYYVVVTDNNGGGTILQSDNATLTINASLIAVFASAQVNDPWATIEAGSDPFTYSYSQNIVNNANISWNLLNADNNKFFIFKEPISQTAKTSWYNTLLNNGLVPDSVMRTPVEFGGMRYIVSRIEYAYDISQPTILSS